MAFIRKQTITNVGEDGVSWGWDGRRGILMHCLWEFKLVQPVWKSEWRIPSNTKDRSII
jgi:hypothetical protein